jgi:hypothetical protein
MTTSSQEYLPRHMDFLFSRKRLNVALSRARSLAILIANPRLLETAGNTVEQMGLINTLCRGYYAGTPENIPSPSWHGDVLRAREKRISEGRSHFLDIAEAKKAVREQLK